jgi:hypothetical protein
VAIWDELRADLLRLETADPRVLHSYPNPRGDGTGTLSVRLAAFAEDVAAELHAKYGSSVQLTVGALPYPLDRQGAPAPVFGRDPLSNPVSTEFEARLAEPLVLRSGHAISHGLLVTNRAHRRAVLHTNGRLDSIIVDLHTGQVVGGSTLPSEMPLVPFAVSPGETVAVPVFVGTESCEPSLGFRLPPGQWGLIALLEVHYPDQSDRAQPTTERTTALPFTVTD